MKFISRQSTSINQEYQDSWKSAGIYKRDTQMSVFDRKKGRQNFLEWITSTHLWYKKPCVQYFINDGLNFSCQGTQNHTKRELNGSAVPGVSCFYKHHQKKVSLDKPSYPTWDKRNKVSYIFLLLLESPGAHKDDTKAGAPLL